MPHHSKPPQADTAPRKQRTEKENKTCALHRFQKREASHFLTHHWGIVLAFYRLWSTDVEKQCYVSSETTPQLVWHFNSLPLQMLPPSKETHASMGEAAIV